MPDKNMLFKIGARDDASTAFARVAAAAEALEKQLDRLDKIHAKPKVTADTEAARTRVADLAKAFRELKNVRVRADVDLGTGRAEVGDLRREMSLLRDARVKVRVDTGASLTDMAELGAALASFRDARASVDLDTGQALAGAAALRASLDELADVKIKVELDAGEARTELAAIARAARRLSGVDGQTIRIKIEVDAAGAVIELAAIATMLREIRGTTRHRVSVDTGNSTTAVAELGGAVEDLLGSLGSLAQAAGAGIAVPGVLATIGLVGSLGTAVQDLSGILGLIPGASTAAVAGIAALTVGLSNVADALGPTGTAAQLKKVNEAVADLSPAAREAVGVIRSLEPAWAAVRTDVQERMFAGLGKTIGEVSQTYLPTLKSGLGGITEEINRSAKGFAGWATSGAVVNDVNTIFGNTRETLRELAPSGEDVAAAFLDIATVGSEMLPELADGTTALTGRFREFIAEARQSGELEQWIRGGITSVEQLGRIAGDTGSVLATVFSASDEAGYDFLDLVEQVTSEVDALLSTPAGRNALVDLFRESGDAVNQLIPGVRDLGGAVLSAVGAFAQSNGLEQFAELLSDAGTAVAPLVMALGSLAGETLGALSGGAKLAVGALSPIIGVVSAITTGLGPLPGLVLASVIAFRGLSVVAPMLLTLGTSLQVASISANAFVGATTGSAAAALAANRAVSGLGSAFTAVGRALPVIGIALIGAGFAIEHFTADFDEATQKVLSGSQSMQQAIAEQAAIIDMNEIAWLGGRDAAESYALAQQEVTSRVQSAIASMGPLEAAQARATLAQTAYNDAVRETGPTSARSTSAARDLAAATDAVEAAQRAAQDATKTYSDRLREQADAAMTALGANLQLEDALARVVAAQAAANEATAQHGASSTEAAAANREFVAAADQAAQSAARVAEANAAGLGAAAAADAGTAAYGATLLGLAATATGPAQAALLGHISQLSDAQLQALSAGAAATGFATQLLTLPDGRTVTIAVDPQTGEIVETQTLLDSMQDADVAVNLEAQAALDGLASFIGRVNGAAGTVTIDGNPQAAGTALQTVLAAIASGQASVSINGQTVPAQQALGAIVGQINASGATVTINGQSAPAGQVLSQVLGAINAGQGTVTINGQRVPADAALRALIGSVNSSSGTISILGRDAGVAALKANLSRASSSTHTIFVRTVGGDNVPGRGTITRNHDGNVVGAGSTWFAAGGTHPGGRPFRAGRAQVFPPKHLRYTGDRSDVDEFYIPDNRSARSLALGAEWARRRGLSLVPGDSSSTRDARPTGSAAPSRAMSAALNSATAARSTGAMQVPTPPGRLPAAAGTAQVDLRPLAAELRGFLQAALGRDDQGAVVAAVDRLAGVLTGPQRMSAEGHRLAGTDGHW